MNSSKMSCWTDGQSVGRPMRAARSVKRSRTSSVPMMPGLTRFTVMPEPPSSLASEVVMAGSAPLAT